MKTLSEAWCLEDGCEWRTESTANDMDVYRAATKHMREAGHATASRTYLDR